MLLLSLLFLSLTAPETLLAADPYPRQAGIDVEHYTFRLRLYDETDEIQGEAAVRVRFVVSDLDTFELDLASIAEDRGMRVSGVTHVGAAVRWTHDRNRLRLTLPRAVRVGERLEFVVSYGGVPAAGLFIGDNKHGE